MPSVAARNGSVRNTRRRQATRSKFDEVLTAHDTTDGIAFAVAGGSPPSHSEMPPRARGVAVEVCDEF